MWKLFKKSPEDKLKNEYKKLMDESYRLSTLNRKESDKKYVEAEAIMDKLESIKV